jgi:hypothetical protein
MKKFIFISLLVVAISSLNAQGLHFGPQIGFSSTSVIEKSSLGTVDKKMKLGYQFGVAGELEIMSFLYINGAVTFFQKGDKMGDENFSAKTKIGYIDIPITVGYKMPIGNISVFGNIGPYTSVAIMAKSVYHDFISDFEEDHPLEIGGDFGYYKRFDTGVTFGGGVEFKQYQIKVNYAFGFVDITEGEFVSSKNSVLNITATYFIGRNY